MGSKPKIPPTPPPPAPPPAPNPVAQKAKVASNNKGVAARKKRGTSSLTVRRSSLTTGSSGSGANVNY